MIIMINLKKKGEKNQTNWEMIYDITTPGDTS